MDVFILFITAIILVLFILENLGHFTIPLSFGFIIGSIIISLYLTVRHLVAKMHTHVSQKQQTAIILFSEKAIADSNVLKVLHDKALSIVSNHLNSSIDAIALRLSLPLLKELKGSVFYNYYKCFYLCAETLSLLYVYKERPIDSPLKHPMNEIMIRKYNTMSEKDERTLETYPWLLTYC